MLVCSSSTAVALSSPETSRRDAGLLWQCRIVAAFRCQDVGSLWPPLHVRDGHLHADRNSGSTEPALRLSDGRAPFPGSLFLTRRVRLPAIRIPGYCHTVRYLKADRTFERDRSCRIPFWPDPLRAVIPHESVGQKAPQALFHCRARSPAKQLGGL